MAKKPPVVWHLDTDGIDDYRYNPDDRLTMIKRIMQCAQNENSQINLDKALKAIEKICKNQMTQAELEKFLEENDCSNLITQ